jgi:hypothetical protein
MEVQISTRHHHTYPIIHLIQNQLRVKTPPILLPVWHHQMHMTGPCHAFRLSLSEHSYGHFILKKTLKNVHLKNHSVQNGAFNVNWPLVNLQVFVHKLVKSNKQVGEILIEFNVLVEPKVVVVDLRTVYGKGGRRGFLAKLA